MAALFASSSPTRFSVRLLDLLTASDVVGLATDIIDTSSCLYDEFSKGFIEKYPDAEKLSSQDALAELFGVAALARVDARAIERRHAHLRRLTELRAAMSSTRRSLQIVSCDFTLLRVQRQQNFTPDDMEKARSAKSGIRRAGRPKGPPR